MKSVYMIFFIYQMLYRFVYLFLALCYEDSTAFDRMILRQYRYSADILSYLVIAFNILKH